MVKYIKQTEKKNKTEIMYTIDKLQKKCFSSSLKNNMKNIRILFAYLSQPDTKTFIFLHPMYKKMVKKKLIEFYKEDNLREALCWYRRIFNERIPC